MTPLAETDALPIEISAAMPGSLWFCVESVSAVKTLSIRQIKEATCRYFSLSMNSMVTAARGKECLRPRQIAIYLCHELTRHSYPTIGRHFGNRDHTTALHAFRAIEARILTEPPIAAAVSALRAELEALL